MAKEKSKDKKLKSLYKQLSKVQNQPSERDSKKYGWPILTLRGRLESRILTLENTK